MSEEDKAIIAEARQKDVNESGWEELSTRCSSDEAREEIRIIETKKWRRQEYEYERD